MLIAARTSIHRALTRSLLSSSVRAKEIDPVQEASLNEQCFLVDTNDKIIGQASKKECHLVQKNGDIPLHRAFSVFLFNKKGDLLLQKRASTKVRFPEYYTNSCCEHPVAKYPGENEENNAMGAKRAAVRRLNHELGIPKELIPIENIQYITRIYYKDEGDGKWGDHEINYVLFLQTDIKIKPDLKPNPNEISEISFIPRDALDVHIPTLVTYPNYYTNSCCSHPIADFPAEAEEDDAIGIKKAAIRRLNFELGIPVESITINNLKYITRIHYKDEGNGKWGEHEIDYVIFLQADFKVKPNPNEVSEICLVPRNELDDFIPTLSGPLTPWFELILKHRLRLWWDNLDNIEEFQNHDKILKFTN